MSYLCLISQSTPYTEKTRNYYTSTVSELINVRNEKESPFFMFSSVRGTRWLLQGLKKLITCRRRDSSRHGAREGECGWQILLLILKNSCSLHHKMPSEEFGQALLLKTQIWQQQQRFEAWLSEVNNTTSEHHRKKKAITFVRAGREICPQLKATMGFLSSASDRQLQSHLRKQLKVFTAHWNVFLLRYDHYLWGDRSYWNSEPWEEHIEEVNERKCAKYPRPQQTVPSDLIRVTVILKLREN